jgi:two-component system cell cycle response regulator
MEHESDETLSAGVTRGAFDELKLAERLPSPPGLGLAILGLTRDEQESPEALFECIRADPALTGRLLKLANSSRPGGSEPAATARAAAALLDRTAIRSIALSFSLVPKDPDEVCEAFDYRRHWLLSLACAAAAEALARRFRSGDPEEAFTLGLLCHVGLLAMATVHPEDFAGILRKCEGKGPVDLVLAEVRALRINHWQVAADLMADWGLSESFLAPVQTLSRTALGARSEDAVSACSTSLLTLAVEMAGNIVASPSAGASGNDTAGTQAADSEAGRRPEREEVSLARQEATRRWRELVDLCGLDPLPHRASIDGRTGADPVGDTSARGSQEPVAESDRTALETSVPGGAGISAGSVGGTSALDPEETIAESDQAALETSVPARIRILVVDDDPGARHLLGVHLRRAGYEVIAAQDGESGLRAALAESPHMVITDWMMPGLSGLDLCKALRRMEAGRKIYLLVLTSREEEDSIVEGLEAGANDYLTKPFNPRILLARVHAGQRVIDMQRQIEIDRQVDKRREAQLGQLTRKLRSVALMDDLTGLRNRRFAMTQLEEAWSAAERYGRPLSVVMIDIDHFKRVNDGYGHLVGDAVLRATAEVLRSKIRSSDVVCRLGGEEFLVICVNGGLRGAEICAERLRSSVESHTITHPGFAGRVTVSLGVAEYSPGMRSIDDLVKAADEAVYKAKSLGRNRVCSSGSSQDQVATA